MLNLKEATLEIVEELKRAGVTIQFYKARSSESYYLQLDHGVCGSIRISDHEGKRRYYNRYELRSDIDDFYISGGINEIRHYPLSPGGIRNLIFDVLDHRYSLYKKYGRLKYRRKMNEGAVDSFYQDREEESYWVDVEMLA